MRQVRRLSIQNWHLSGSAWLRIAVPPVLTLCLVVVLRDRFTVIDPHNIHQALTAFSLGQWVTATGLCGISYWALGRYDASCHRVLKTGIPRARATRSGMVALAVSQTVGVGVLSGALARWRLLPELSATRVLAVSGFVALSFMAIWAAAAITVIALGLAGPDLPDWARIATRVAMGIIGGLLAVLVIWPRGWPRRGRQALRRRDIGLRRLAGLGLYACVDMLAAAGIVVILLDQPIPAAQVAAAVLLALGAGLLSGTSAGLGAFELTLLALLPQADPAALLAAVTGYRLIYFTLPALAGLAVLAHPPLLAFAAQASNDGWQQTCLRDPGSPRLDAMLATAPFGEARLASRPDMALLWSHRLGAGGVVGTAGRSLVLLRDPFPTARAAEVLSGFDRHARDHGLTPCLYKCSARTAVLARQQGYHVIRLGCEAWLDPGCYTTEDRSRRQLRRKLRHAAKAGLRFGPVDADALPLRDTTRVNAAWSESHGGERGFSMGRFCPDLIAAQRVYLAWQGERLIGFASFHQVASEWSLDLLRPAPDGPDGTAHGLIDCAIRDAAAHGIPRVSLAAAPRDPAPDQNTRHRDWVEPSLSQLQRHIAHRAGGTGLVRFKTMFAPQWQRLYFAAPSRQSLLSSGLEISRAISHPPTLRPTERAHGPVEQNSQLL